MKIGLVTTWFERGAAYVSRQFMECLEENHEVFIYARGGEKYAKGDPNWDLPNVCWAPRLFIPGESTILSRRHFRKWILRNGIELVIFNEQAFWAPVLWCNEWGVRTIAYVDYYRELSIPLFAAYDLLICNTRRHYDAFSWYENARYVPWGTDCDLFAPRWDPAGEPPVNDPVKFFVSAGMAPERKGVDRLIRAFAGMSVPAKLLIHTQVDLKARMPGLAGTVDELEQAGRLRIVMKTIPAPGLYHEADVYVYPFRLDGLGLTVAEAMSCGLPCIVTDSAPANEFITPDTGMTVKVERCYCREDGYYWPMCDADIADLTRVLELYAKNPEMVMRQKINAVKHARSNYNWAKNSLLLREAVSQCEFRKKAPDLIRRVLAYDNRGVRKYRSALVVLYWILRKLKLAKAV